MKRNTWIRRARSKGLTNPGSEWAVPLIVGHLLTSGVAPAIFWAEETPKEAPSLSWKVYVGCPHRGHQTYTFPGRNGRP